MLSQYLMKHANLQPNFENDTISPFAQSVNYLIQITKQNGILNDLTLATNAHSI